MIDNAQLGQQDPGTTDEYIKTLSGQVNRNYDIVNNLENEIADLKANMS